MTNILVAACVLLSLAGLALGVLSGPRGDACLVAGAILLGAATIAVAIPERGGGEGPSMQA